MKTLSLTLSALCLSAFLAPTQASYPFVIYQRSNGNNVPVEVTKQVSFADAFASYKEQAEGKTNMIVFVKDGLQTISIADNSNSLPLVKSRILGNSKVYTDVKDGFSLSEFEKGVGAHSNYNI